MSKKPLILITNDDGVTAKGIRTLVEVMQELGDVIVVAPDKPQSGMGHAITLAEPLMLREVDIFDGVKAYECSGTPADCVKLAKDKLLPNRMADLCVSGINHGSNSSINVIYSGTMSAAIEAGIEGMKAIGFSLLDYDDKADFSEAKQYVKEIAKQVLEKGLPERTVLNVNIPKISENPIKGIKVCRQALGKWEENCEERQDPFGRKYYWLMGEFVNPDKGEDTDDFALKSNYVSVVPIQFDMTAHHALKDINELFVK